MRLVLDYHPLLSKAQFARLLRDQCQDRLNCELIQAIFGKDVILDLALSWRLSAKPFASRLVSW